MIRIEHITALALALALATPVHADEETSRTLFAQGRELRASGSCGEAIVFFRQAYEANRGGLGSLRNIAECEEELGRYASARRSWWELRVAVLDRGEEKYSGWDEHANAARERLASQVARLTVEVIGPGALHINREPISASLVGTELERDVGRHVIEVMIDGKVVASQLVDLNAGAQRRVELRVSAVPDPDPGPDPEPNPHAVPIEPADHTLAITGYVLIGVGGAALIGAGIAAGVRQGALDDLDAMCPNHEDGATCPTAIADTVSTGQTAATMVTALAIGGGVLAATGITLAIVGQPDQPQQGLTIQPVFGGSFAGVTGTF